MNLSPPHSSAFKVGLKSTASDSNPNSLHQLLHILPPLPVFRKDLLHSCKLKENLRLKGYKLFAKLSASGPETFRILKEAEKSCSIKRVQNFEFDPYLCDQSHLNSLKRVFHKIKTMKHLNLVVRRIDSSNEVTNLCSFIARFSRLQSLRIEFPNTQDICEDELIELYRTLGKFTFLKSLDWIDVNMPERSLKFNEVGITSMSRLRSLENLRLYSTLKKGAIKNEDPPKKPKNMRPYKVKVVDVTFSATGQWANQGMEKDYKMQALKEIFTYAKNVH